MARIMYCPTCGHQNIPGVDACAKCEFPLSRLDDPTANDRVERSLMNDSVAVLNPRLPVTVEESADLGRAIRMMTDRKVGAVLVTNASGGLAGILTERDFLMKVSGDFGFEALPVRDFMTANPESVTTSDKLAFVLGKMDAGGYRHLPVVEDGKPVGVISVRDILRHVTGLCQDA